MGTPNPVTTRRTLSSSKYVLPLQKSFSSIFTHSLRLKSIRAATKHFLLPILDLVSVCKSHDLSYCEVEDGQTNNRQLLIRYIPWGEKVFCDCNSYTVLKFFFWTWRVRISRKKVEGSNLSASNFWIQIPLSISRF